MAKCKRIDKPHRKICAGSLRKLIKVQTRDITSPADCVDFDETFADLESVFAMVETRTGETIFDDTNTEQVVTHRIYIRFLPTVTAETWLEIDGDKYDILNVENLDHRNEYLLLRCNKRGTNTKKVNFA